jgi:hypothetical protein
MNEIISSLMMEAARTSETSVDNHFTRQYNPEDSSEQPCSCLQINYTNFPGDGQFLFVYPEHP